MLSLRRFALLFLVVLLSLAAAMPAAAQAGQLVVFYPGQSDAVGQALELSEELSLTSNPAEAEVVVINGSLPSAAADLAAAGEETPLVIILGEHLSAEVLQPLLAVSSLAKMEQSVSLVEVKDIQLPLLQDIIWTSAPQVHDWYELKSPALQPLVESYETGAQVLSSTRAGERSIYILHAPVEPQLNHQLQQWGYFNYLIYHLVKDAAGQPALSYGSYNASPVPHARERNALLLGLGAVTLLSFFLFWRIRRYSLAHPEALDEIVQDSRRYLLKQASTPWDRVGFHRPLGGFLFALMLGLVFFIPLIIYQNMILPSFILPSAQALGIWGRVTQFFAFMWQFFDMGTSIAFIKYYSQYRVDQPRKGIQYAQLYVWWQLLSGAIQVSLIAIAASTFLPQTAYALYAWSIVLHAIVQVPGFFTIMRDAFAANQRFDFAQMLDMAVSLVLPMLVQPIFVTLMVIWGRGNPVFGPAMGGVLGMGVSAYVVQLLSFLLGLSLYRRLGYNARILFLAHFDWGVIKSAFRFGVFEMLGSVAWAIGQAMEIVITQRSLINYAEIWGNWGLAQNFIFAFQVIATLFNNLMSSMSEAISSGYKVLSRYYSMMAYKWGGLISAFIGAVLLAVADRFILGASGPDFTRAAIYVIPLVIWGAVQYPSWIGDNVQLAANKPYLKSILVAGEQTIRIILGFLLVGRFQVTGLIIAYFVGLLSKDIAAYFINNKVCFRQGFAFWQSLFAPVLAGALHYFVLRYLTGFIWKGEQLTSVLIFFIAILPSFPLFAFFYGLFGGWDDGTLAELQQAVPLSSFMKPLTWLFWKATALGARISPLHNRFPIRERETAMQEAAALTLERVDLASEIS